MVQIKGLRFFGAILYLGACLTASGAAERDQKPTARDTMKIPVPTRIKPVDINSGSMEQLRALPGIHYGYAEKIIAGRPYQRKQELVSRKILPEPVFEKIKNRIITVNQEAEPGGD